MTAYFYLALFFDAIVKFLFAERYQHAVNVIFRACAVIFRLVFNEKTVREIPVQNARRAARFYHAADV